MNDKYDRQDQPAEDEARLERLVDGELSPDEYRELVSALEVQPDGWRRCALAFLESQALGSELRSLRRGAEGRERETTGPQAAAARRPAIHGWSLLAIAASFLAAFGLGVVAPQFLGNWRQDLEVAGNLNSGQSQGPTAADHDAPHRALRPIGNVTLVMDGPSGASTQAGQVPVYEVHEDLSQYLSTERPALSPELVEWLRQRGFDVRHQPQYVPAPLDDGRQMIVPIDGYQITPVGRRY